MICLFMRTTVNIALIVTSITFTSYAQSSADSISIYLVKNYWHVGIVFGVEHLDRNQLTCLDDFRRFKYVDIGWGDEEFYQNEDIDYYLGAKAILFPTSSVVRVAGYNFDIHSIINSSDFTIELNANRNQFNKLMKYIDSSFTRTDSGCIQTLEKSSGDVVFYKSIHSYHLFNTCNTWIYDCLKYAEFELREETVITSDELFYSVIPYGRILKIEK